MITPLVAHSLVYGIVLSVALTVLIVGSLYLNPRMWMQDFPEAIRAKLPPLTASEKRSQRLLMVPFLALMLGVPFYAAWSLKAQAGGIAFLDAFASAFIVLNIFNLVDAVVIDLLWLTFNTPKFAIPAGAGDLPLHLRDWGMHFTNFLKGIAFAAVMALLIGGVVTALPL